MPPENGTTQLSENNLWWQVFWKAYSWICLEQPCYRTAEQLPYSHYAFVKEDVISSNHIEAQVMSPSL